MGQVLEDERIRWHRPTALGDAELLEVRDLGRRWKVFHDRYAFCLIHCGGGDYLYRGRLHEARPGTVHLLEPGNIHRDTQAARSSDFTVLFIGAGEVASALGIPREQVPHLKDGLSTRPGVARRLLLLLQSLERPARGAPREALADFLTELFEHHAEPSALLAARPRPGLRRVVERMRERPGEPFSLDEMARLAGLSNFHFLRSFRAAYGATPHQYLIGLRVARARQLLGTGAAAIDVAQEVGMADQSHLHRHFKASLGVTPLEYARGIR